MGEMSGLELQFGSSQVESLYLRRLASYLPPYPPQPEKGQRRWLGAKCLKTSVMFVDAQLRGMQPRAGTLQLGPVPRLLAARTVLGT